MELKSFKYFYPERPTLIHKDQELFGRLSDDPLWVAEPKYNGSRLLLYGLPSGSFELWNRHGEKFSYTPSPELAAALAALPLEPGTLNLFDGELRHNKTVGVRHQIVLYDCFIFGNKLLTGVPFRERRGILATLQKRGGYYDCLSIAPQFSFNFRQVFDELTPNPEIEGLVLKRLDGLLALGRKAGINSAWMMKVRKPSNVYHF